MSDEAPRHLWRRTADALEKARDEAPSEGPHRIGDLLIVPDASAHGVLWAILDEAVADGRRFLVVPADTQPLVGSADLALPDDGPWGSLRLRGRCALRVEAARLRSARRCGSLEPGQVEAARRKLDALAAGEETGTALERQIDDDPDYREWCDEALATARAALAGDPAADAATAAASGRGRSPYRALGLAASVLLLLGLGAVAGGLWTAGRSESLERDLLRAEERSRQLASRLEDEEARTAELSRMVEDLDAARGRSEDEQRTAVAELERLLEAARRRAVVNPTLAWLAPREATRGGGRTVAVPPDADGIALLLQLRGRRSFPSYRLEIRREPSGELVWSHDALRRTDDAEVPVVLPRGTLPPASYRLRLFGEGPGAPDPVAEYDLDVTNE